MGWNSAIFDKFRGIADIYYFRFRHNLYLEQNAKYIGVKYKNGRIDWVWKIEQDNGQITRLSPSFNSV